MGSSNSTCPADNVADVEQEDFWHTIENGGKLEPHQIGWIISGACTIVTVLITIYSVFTHLLHYTRPAEQRQIIRILLLPPVFGIISFFSYRYFRDYYYYSLVQIIYEAVTIGAFMLLIIEFVATTASSSSATLALSRKDKQALPLPFCCWRYRPTKAYFMYTIKWSVLQYVVVRPLVSIAGIVTNALGLYCETGGFNTHFAYAYLEGVDFISISVALYGLFVFYRLTSAELKGRRPLAKFLAIKLIVFATFYQSFVFSILEKTGTIKATTYWTETNVANGLSALCLTVEMVFFSLFMIWAYPVSEYKTLKNANGQSKTAPWRGIIDTLNYSDFIVEIVSSLVFFVRYMFNRPGTHTPKTSRISSSEAPLNRDENDTAPEMRPAVRKDFGAAFGLGPGGRGYYGYSYNGHEQYPRTQPMSLKLGELENGERESTDARRPFLEEQNDDQGRERSMYTPGANARR